MADHIDKQHKTEEEWRSDLTADQYRILRQKGTERPFTGKYVDTKIDGTYVCAGCGQPLFRSDTKYNSGSGWPSFWDVMEDGNVELHRDTSHGMVRTEVICSRCGGHLGHMFEDGPRDTTGLRYCINSASLELKPDEGKDQV